MCVGCMAMVDSVSGGVMYSRDPNNPWRYAIFINAAHGLRKAVVNGTSPRTFTSFPGKGR